MRPRPALPADRGRARKRRAGRAHLPQAPLRGAARRNLLDIATRFMVSIPAGAANPIRWPFRSDLGHSRGGHPCPLPTVEPVRAAPAGRRIDWATDSTFVPHDFFASTARAIRVFVNSNQRHVRRRPTFIASVDQFLEGPPASFFWTDRITAVASGVRRCGGSLILRSPVTLTWDGCRTFSPRTEHRAAEPLCRRLDPLCYFTWPSP